MLQAKNEADTAIYTTEKSLTEYKSKLPQAVVDEITKAIADCRAASQVRMLCWFDCTAACCQCVSDAHHVA